LPHSSASISCFVFCSSIHHSIRSLFLYDIILSENEFSFDSNEELFSTNENIAFDISEINFNENDENNENNNKEVEFKVDINIKSTTIYNYDFIEKIYKNINDKYRDNINDILDENYFEWEFEKEDRENWNSDGRLNSYNFNIGGYMWYLELFKNNEDIFLDVINFDMVDSNESAYICANVVFVLRDNLYKIENIKALKPFAYFYRYFPGKKVINFIKVEDIKNLFENKYAIGIYIRIYNITEMDYIKERFINRLEKLIYNNRNYDNYEILKEGYYEWNIYNWNNIYDPELSNRNSPFFNIGNYDSLLNDLKIVLFIINI